MRKNLTAARTLSPPGKTRVCPHCKSVILDSADVCPACHHHLRFGPKTERRAVERRSAFNVEGVIRQAVSDEPCEYTVVIAIRDEAGQELRRQVIDVGAMGPDEQRTFQLSVEITPQKRPTN